MASYFFKIFFILFYGNFHYEFLPIGPILHVSLEPFQCTQKQCVIGRDEKCDLISDPILFVLVMHGWLEKVFCFNSMFSFGFDLQYIAKLFQNKSLKDMII